MRSPWLLALAAGLVGFLALWLLWKLGRLLVKLLLSVVLVSFVGLLLWYLLHR